MPTPAKTDENSPESSDSGPSRPRRVLKFGGTSVASLHRWERIERIVKSVLEAGARPVVVCSAVSGVTNLIEMLISAIEHGHDVDPHLEAIRAKHRELAEELGVDAEVILAGELATLADQATAPGPVTPRRHALLSSLGEMMSTRLGAAWLAARGHGVTWVDARDILHAEEDQADRPERYLSARVVYEPDPDVQRQIDGGADIVITQGYIARGHDGETVLLGRGGSDAAAACIAAVLDAEGLEIWTDVPGMFTAHPKEVPDARMIRRLSYGEAETMGALGAKVLHPRTIEPARAHGIPMRIGWTAHPEVDGTAINAQRPRRGVKAISARHDMALISMKRGASWQPIGFMAEISAIFHHRGLSMDLVSSSCSEIRCTIDLNAFPSAVDELEELTADLSKVCEPRVFTSVACVSLVGAGVGIELLGQAGALGLFADEAILMIVHAANEHHVSFVVDEHAATELVGRAHAELFGGDDPDLGFGPTWSELMAEEATA